MHEFCHKVACLRPMLGYVAGLSIGMESLRLALSCFLAAAWLHCLHRFLSCRIASLWSIRWMPGIVMICAWLGLGLLTGEHARLATVMPAGFGEGTAVDALAEVTVLPQEREKTWKLGVRICETPDKGWLRRKLVVYLPKNEGAEHLRMGDRLRLTLNPSLPDDVGEDGFDYGRWLRNKGYTATAFVRDWRRVSAADRWNLMALGSRLQESLVSVFRRAGLSEEAMSLVGAMTLGSRESLSGEVNASFAKAGVSHILSVSGFHVAILFALLRASFFFMSYSLRMRRLRDVLIVVCLWAFALVSGLSPAVCRAVLMATMLVVGGVLGRSSSSLNTILFSAWVQLLVEPLLLHDVGFQLSYCAVIGLVVFVPFFDKLWHPSSRIVRYVWSLLTMSLAAQLATAPLTIHYFGQFPLYFLLANLLAVPLSGLLMYLAVACLLTAAIPFLFRIFSFCLSLCSRLFMDVVQGVGALPGSVCSGLHLSVDQVVAVYVLVGCLLVWIGWKRRRCFRWSLVCLLYFQLGFLVEKFVVLFET